MLLSKLKVNPNNPQKFDDLTSLENSIKEFPKMLELRPLVYDPETMYVLGGNKRLICLQNLGYKEIPDSWVKSAKDLTEEEKKRFVVQDNIQIGEWDWDKLDIDYNIEELKDWGIDLLDVEVEQAEAEEDDYEVSEEIQTDIKLGDIFQIGQHRLMCGDATKKEDIEKLLDGEKADMVFTDPPYGMFLDTDYSQIKGSKKSIGFKENKFGNKYEKIIGDNEDFSPELINSIFNFFGYSNEIFIWGADYFIDLIPNYGKGGSWFVWNKRSNEAQQRSIGNTFELCWSKQKHKRLVFDFEWFGFLSKEDPNEARNRVHPSMKPSKLLARFIDNYCKGDIIVDTYLGSGSTMVAAHQLNRKCYGMEIDPKYCQVIIDRMKNLDPNIEIKKLN